MKDGHSRGYCLSATCSNSTHYIRDGRYTGIYCDNRTNDTIWATLAAMKECLQAWWCSGDTEDGRAASCTRFDVILRSSAWPEIPRDAQCILNPSSRSFKARYKDWSSTRFQKTLKSSGEIRKIKPHVTHRKRSLSNAEHDVWYQACACTHLWTIWGGMWRQSMKQRSTGDDSIVPTIQASMRASFVAAALAARCNASLSWCTPVCIFSTERMWTCTNTTLGDGIVQKIGHKNSRKSVKCIL